jgi:hypothetical protein
MRGMQFRKWILPISIILLTITGACAGTPAIITSARPVATIAGKGTYVVTTDPPTVTPSITKTATITPTATAVPDVELAQLQIIGFRPIIAEIVNHLNVPVVFEEGKPSFRFDIYDPKLDHHWIEEEPVQRFDDQASVPCVLYPGEHAFFMDFHILYNWEQSGSDPSQLKITYQSLGVPRPDWTNNGTQLKVWDEQWKIDGNVLNFSFRHDPVKIDGEKYYYFASNIGFYDKDDHLLGVAGGRIDQTIQTGIADGYWVSLNGATTGYYPLRGYALEGVKELATRMDHFHAMVEVLNFDGFCLKRPSTRTPAK